MKIVLLPGVRVYKPEPNHENFLKAVMKKTGCDGEIFTWEPGYKHPEYDLPLKTLRDFTYEVILDFQEAVTRATEIVVPVGDIYIGHSAGSIIALVRQKPTVTMASPAPLIELVNKNTANNQKAIDLLNLILRNPNIPILNMMNRYDVLACPFDKPNVENYQYTGSWYNPNAYNPLFAHSDYWTNSKVINKVSDTINNWTKNMLKNPNIYV